MTPKLKKILIKTALFILSLSIAWWLVKSGFLDNFIDRILPLKYVAEIIAGSFYTSFLTSPISVASPLPDELGLFLLGASKLKDYQILIITYVLNTSGILLIVTPINLLS